MKRISPYFELTQIHSRINQLFDTFFAPSQREEFAPAVDVYETQDFLVAVFEVPGAEFSTLNLAVMQGYLVLEGEKLRLAEANQPTEYFCVEREYGKFRRAVLITCAVNSHAAQAEFKRGILTVKLPKVPERRGRTVKIEVANKE